MFSMPWLFVFLPAQSWSQGTAGSIKCYVCMQVVAALLPFFNDIVALLGMDIIMRLPCADGCVSVGSNLMSCGPALSRLLLSA